MAGSSTGTIAVATGNAHKLTEIETMLGRALPGVRFVSWKELGDFESEPQPIVPIAAFEPPAIEAVLSDALAGTIKI